MDGRSKALNDAFEALLKEAADMAEERLSMEIDELDKSIPDEAVVFSAEKEKEMLDIFKKWHRERRMKRIGKYCRRAACVLIIAAVGLAVAAFSVDAWRVKFLNYVFDSEAPNMDYSFSDSAATYSDDKIQLGYIPEGFELKESDITKNSTHLFFVGGDEKWLGIDVYPEDSDGSVNIEAGVSEEVKINNMDGIYTSKENYNALIWHDGNLAFSVDGNILKEELLKIAENMQVKK